MTTTEKQQRIAAFLAAPVKPLNLPERRRCDNSPCREWFTPTLLRRFHCSWVAQTQSEIFAMSFDGEMFLDSN